MDPVKCKYILYRKHFLPTIFLYQVFNAIARQEVAFFDNNRYVVIFIFSIKVEKFWFSNISSVTELVNWSIVCHLIPKLFKMQQQWVINISIIHVVVFVEILLAISSHEFSYFFFILFFQVNISMLARYSLQIIGSLIIMFILSPKLTAVLISVVPVIGIGAQRYGISLFNHF